MASLLAVALLAVVGVIVYRDLRSNGSDEAAEVVTGVIGSEKLPFLYLAIASYVANGDTVVSDRSAVDSVAPVIGRLFVDQGYQPATTEVLFEDYLSSGMGRVPMALVYEAQFGGQQLAQESVLPNDARVLYPRPTVFSRHVLVPLTAAGDRVGQLLEQDPELAELAAQHGFRPTQPGPFAQTLKSAGVPEPPELIDVVEPPTFETSEQFLGALGCAA